MYRYGAEKGYPSYFFYYANELYDQGEKGEAFEFYRRAAETGEPRAFFWFLRMPLGQPNITSRRWRRPSTKR